MPPDRAVRTVIHLGGALARPASVTMADTGDSFDHLLKILLVGDTGVGKSCILLRFTTDRYIPVSKLWSALPVSTAPSDSRAGAQLHHFSKQCS